MQCGNGEGDNFGVARGGSEKDGVVERLGRRGGLSAQLEQRLVFVELEELVRFLGRFPHVGVSASCLLGQGEVVVHEESERRHRRRSGRREEARWISRVHFLGK